MSSSKSKKTRNAYIVVLALGLGVFLLLFSFLSGRRSSQTLELGDFTTDVPEALRSTRVRQTGQNAVAPNEAARMLSTLRDNPRDSSEGEPTTDLQSAFARLWQTTDLNEKRELRERIAALEPTRDTLIFSLEQYHAAKATGDREKLLHVTSIIDQINAASIVEEVFALARESHDEELFLSLVYSLGKANTTDAKKALFALMADNSLSARPGDEGVLNNQGLAGLYRNLMDTLNREDFSWLQDFLKTSSLSQAQALMLRQFIKKFEIENK